MYIFRKVNEKKIVFAKRMPKKCDYIDFKFE